MWIFAEVLVLALVFDSGKSSCITCPAGYTGKNCETGDNTLITVNPREPVDLTIFVELSVEIAVTPPKSTLLSNFCSVFAISCVPDEISPIQFTRGLPWILHESRILVDLAITVKELKLQ